MPSSSNPNGIKASSSMTTPLLSSGSSRTARRGGQKGQLTAVVLSAYDLPSREPPLYVKISIPEKYAAQTGPPCQRHKDRNSFKFGSNGASSSTADNQISLRAPLPELYTSTLRVDVVSDGPESATLTATYRLEQLQVGVATWLILNLEESTPSSAVVPDTSDVVPPTLRLQMTLDGPYRTEIGALVNWGQAWFRFVDQLEASGANFFSKLPLSIFAIFNSQWMLVLVVPIVAVLVVSAPIWVGFLAVTLPMLLPLLVAGAAVLFTVATVLLILYASTNAGREQVSGICMPVVHTLLASRSGQRLVYQTGPRPTPVGVAKAILPVSLWQKLFVSLWIDFMGSASYLLPIVGEGLDIAWAPLQTILIMAMYDTTSPNLKYISFLEEILPFTDIVPSATAGWLKEFGVPLLFGPGHGEPMEVKDLMKVLLSPPRTGSPTQSSKPPPAASSATPMLVPAS